MGRDVIACIYNHLDGLAIKDTIIQERREKRLPSQQKDLFISPLIVQQRDGKKVLSACRVRPMKLAQHFLCTYMGAWTHIGPVDWDSAEQHNQHPGRESSTRLVTL